MAGVVVLAVAGLVVALRLAPSPGSEDGSARGAAVGAQAPSMTLPATAGGSVSLAGLRGSKVVVYFYEGSG
jgi:hypothetical protein